MTALFGFAVGFTTTRPIIVDEHIAYVTVLGEDSLRGLIDARRSAVEMTHGFAVGVEMVTSVDLVSCEL